MNIGCLCRATDAKQDICENWVNVKEGGTFARMVQGDPYQNCFKTIKDWQYYEHGHPSAAWFCEAGEMLKEPLETFDEMLSTS